MRAVLALCAALFLSACVFSSETPLFDESEAATPFADGERFLWSENGRNPELVVYRRIGRAYSLAPEIDKSPMRILFIAVTDTPEEDYIAQVQLVSDEAVRAYAFMWRTETGWRIVAAPQAFAEDSPAQALMQTLCAARANSECEFARREDVLTFYREAAHPIFVSGGARPESYMDQTPTEGASPRTK